MNLSHITFKITKFILKSYFLKFYIKSKIHKDDLSEIGIGKRKQGNGLVLDTH